MSLYNLAYTARFAARMMLFHIVFISLGVGLFVGGYKASEGSDGSGAPYFITGMILAGVNLIALLLEFQIFLYLVTKKRFMYSAARRSHTLKLFLVVISYAYGVVGVGVTASLGFCEEEGEKECYYTKNTDANMGIAGGLVALHLLFVLGTFWKLQDAKSRNLYTVSDSSQINTAKRLDESIKRAEKIKALSKHDSPKRKKIASDTDSFDSSCLSSQSDVSPKPLPRKSKLSSVALASMFVSSVQKTPKKVEKDRNTPGRRMLSRRRTDLSAKRHPVSPPPPYDELTPKRSVRNSKKLERRITDINGEKIQRRQSGRRPSDLGAKIKIVPPPSYDEAARMPRKPPHVGLVSRPSNPYWVPPPPENDIDHVVPENIYTGSAYPDSHPEVSFAMQVRHSHTDSV